MPVLVEFHLNVLHKIVISFFGIDQNLIKLLKHHFTAILCVDQDNANMHHQSQLFAWS